MEDLQRAFKLVHDEVKKAEHRIDWINRIMENCERLSNRIVGAIVPLPRRARRKTRLNLNVFHKEQKEVLSWQGRRKQTSLTEWQTAAV